MKKLILLLVAFTFIFSACTKNNQVKIIYQATGSISEYNLYYTDANGNLVETQVNPQSAQDKWTFSFAGEEGNIVYLSGKYEDINSGLNLMIKLDGKIYKQVSNEGDTLRYLTVSGVVPYK
jgi:hypothetical protein